MKDIAFELRLDSNASIEDIRKELRSNYYYHCSPLFTSECMCSDEQDYYINKDESLIKQFNSLVDEQDQIDL